MKTFDRRAWIKLVLAGAAGAAVDPEMLIWTPKPIVTVPGPGALTLAEWARRMKPSGVSDLVELLSQTNKLLDEIPWVEGPPLSAFRIHGRLEGKA